MALPVRDAGAVEIDEAQGRVHIVDRLARVLFKVDPLDPVQPLSTTSHG